MESRDVLPAQDQRGISGFHPGITLANVNQQFERLFLSSPVDENGGSPLARVVQAAGLDGLNLEVSNANAHVPVSVVDAAEHRVSATPNQR